MTEITLENWQIVRFAIGMYGIRDVWYDDVNGSFNFRIDDTDHQIKRNFMVALIFANELPNGLQRYLDDPLGLQKK